MSSIDRIPNIEFLGDAVPFVGRIREIIEVIKLFEDFEPPELEALARYMRAYRAPLGAEVIREGDEGDFMLLILEGASRSSRRMSAAWRRSWARPGRAKPWAKCR